MLDRLTAAALQLAVAALAFMPLPMSRRLGSAAAWLFLVTRSRAARAARSNIDVCFPDLSIADRDALVRASLRATGALVAETGMLWHWSKARWQRTIESVRGDELIASALTAGRGVLLLAPHYGNWELLNLYLGERFGMLAMYDRPRIAAVDRVLRAQRARAGSELVPATISGIRALRRGLASARLVGVLPDQVPGEGAGVYAPFFARPALTMTLPQRLVKRTGALTVVGYARRTAAGRFEIAFQAVPDSTFADEPVSCAAAINACIEAIVRTDPAQYQWQYKRFKHGPPELPRLY